MTNLPPDAALYGDRRLADACARAARSFAGALSPAGRTAALAPLEARRDWHYTPRARHGLTLAAMAPPERAALWDLLGAMLSPQGLARAKDVLKVETILRDMTGDPTFRDPENYAIALFGDPNVEDVFAWRFEGHHLSISVLVAAGVGVAATPCFFGANPARAPEGHRHSGFRLLGAEEDRAFDLFRSLEGPARARALLGDRTLGDIVAGPGRETALTTFEGAPLAMLSEGQRTGVFALLERFAGALRAEIADAALARVRADGVDGLHFAWAGADAPGAPHYFRIHGPSMLFEYDNTQNGANHVHTVWIDPKTLFGDDLIRRHHLAAHR